MRYKKKIKKKKKKKGKFVNFLDVCDASAGHLPTRGTLAAGFIPFDMCPSNYTKTFRTPLLKYNEGEEKHFCPNPMWEIKKTQKKRYHQTTKNGLEAFAAEQEFDRKSQSAPITINRYGSTSETLIHQVTSRGNCVDISVYIPAY